MSKCDIDIELNDGPSYHLGDKVTGIVRVRVNADCQCNGLRLERRWRTHGRGNVDSGAAQTIGLFKGTWSAGGKHEYPFEFEIPAEGPISYHGHYLNVDWYLNARADIPWAIDPKAEQEFIAELPAGSKAADAYTGGVNTAVPAHLTTPSGPGQVIGAAVGILFFLVGAVLAISGVLDADEDGVARVLAGGLFAAVGLFLFFSIARNRLAKRVLGDVELTAAPTTLPPGGQLRLALRFTPRRRGRVNGITAVLKGAEVVTSGSGTSESTYRHPLHESTVSLAGGQDLRPGERIALETQFRLPEDAHYSFAASDNQIAWSIAVHIDVARWPDWTRSVQLLVRPSQSQRLYR